MHNPTIKLVFVTLFASVSFIGCASQTPVLDQNFGEAVNAAKAQQTINPDASQNTDPVAGVDGQAANAAVDRYHKSFEQPPVTSNVFNIGVGTGSTTGTGAAVR
ncbi:MAG: hypothetical protein Q7T88_00905 [Methylotenera sp.]|nr:hypothetical protein [Methylotenera sp.]